MKYTAEIDVMPLKALWIRKERQLAMASQTWV